MTSQPAARVHLQDRGILRPGMAADITVFDPATIRDVSTFEDPNALLGRHTRRAGERPRGRRTGRITASGPGGRSAGPASGGPDR